MEKKIWFKRKQYGWGWYPVTWQGWTVIAAYVSLIFFFAGTIDRNSPVREVAFTFLIPVAALTVMLIRVCYRTGEKPKWQWGSSKEEKEK
ncbi:MAG: hypothetical protein AAB407_03005 [Patescibacteria group bacterium]